MRWLPAAGIAVLGVLALTAPLGALYVTLETRQVPLERLAANLERERQDDPKNVQTVINLARLHAMAFALKRTELPATDRTPDKVERPFYGYEERLVPDRVEPAFSREQEQAARAALTKAVAFYEQALALDAANLTARLGHAWTLEQAGRKADAIAEYRRVIEQAWAVEQKARSGKLGQRFYTEEAAGYLIALLNPTTDAEEIATLQAHREALSAMPRPVTPIAIPLDDDLPLGDLLDPLARVQFDADGSGLRREWTWIAPKAGWLVYDATDRGTITSALQLFGSVSFWLFWSNGYDALAALDDDGDGVLRGGELAHLAVWVDRDRDGTSDPGEVRSLSAHGIVALSCAYTDGDGSRIAAMSPDGARLANGRTRPTYDVILRAPGTSLTRLTH
jgi:tetratricopeptide (TPR) repeat protein